MLWSGMLAGYQTPDNRTNAFLGATLFAFSDAMIFAKSVVNFEYHDLIIMGTYYAAQLNISLWSIKQFEESLKP